MSKQNRNTLKKSKQLKVKSHVTFTAARFPNGTKADVLAELDRRIDLLQSEAGRLKAIRRLRSMPYDEYLQSGHWRDMRRRALKVAERKCSRCAATTDLQVHHKTYDSRGAEELQDLEVLCRGCHEQHHESEHDRYTDRMLRRIMREDPVERKTDLTPRLVKRG